MLAFFVQKEDQQRVAKPLGPQLKRYHLVQVNRSQENGTMSLRQFEEFRALIRTQAETGPRTGLGQRAGRVRRPRHGNQLHEQRRHAECGRWQVIADGRGQHGRAGQGQAADLQYLLHPQLGRRRGRSPPGGPRLADGHRTGQSAA
ncbi:hypothetical protein LP420_16610 [Massilia sp. B-10]|nr:hypothetical protein LP420_16610 [Massilia sp. B-10]